MINRAKKWNIFKNTLLCVFIIFFINITPILLRHDIYTFAHTEDAVLVTKKTWNEKSHPFFSDNFEFQETEARLNTSSSSSSPPLSSSSSYLLSNNSLCFSNETDKFQYRKWIPSPDRFLLALCSYSRFSNRIRCFQNYILVASILKRKLIIPYEDLNPYTVPYKYDLAFNVMHFRECFGTNTVLSLNEYIQIHNQSLPLKIDKAMIMYPTRNDIKRKDLFSFPLDTYEYKREKKYLNEKAIRKMFEKIKRKKIITLGDIFVLRQHMLFDLRELVKKELRKDKCKLIFKPSFAVIEAAEGFVHHFIQTKFVALHFRRDDFYEVLLSKGKLWSTLESAECVKEVVRKHNLKNVFIATDAKEEEISILQKAIENSPYFEEKITTFRLQKMEGKAWAASINQLHLSSDPLAIAMVEKVIASMAMVFVYTEFSTFSAHISELREHLNVGCKDECMCEGKAPKNLTLR